MTEKLPDLKELFTPRNTPESFRYSTDFTRELLAEFDTQRRKMHQELETQRKALESGTFLPEEQVSFEPTLESKVENSDASPVKSTARVKERKTGHKFKTIRKNILHMWRSHDVSSKEKAPDVRRSKSCNAANPVDDSRTKADKRSIFGTWRNFPFTSCADDTTIEA
ncbi:hypothetical protein K493DRAFT_298118 [Basidiobolus meristosporus CBS 931.73]|uniref:Uncharacterized protein n=1 Tax=Basidiobolus meristosporus CBS 931.73 TaxID=1314790 RepID=A0A1Y1YVB9_9FUNG|nr:hypothetical protein K493DRAFT_298118 [Basidiobolus meristosporus CBS 931.73]|eukprot:ORY01916.1 hypothetical protein K493DRAFT_298118 [Basidiobolus meristosporus CBS 931.73]